jgi:asparagine synthase (glutamine-hydrolysing)
MCGLHLIIDKQAIGSTGVAALQRMTQQGHHRGPDSHAYTSIVTSRQIVFLGHNRLKVTDLREAANQPFCSPCGRYTLLYNGAVYNYQELRKKLSAYYTFHTDSDTEVVLYHLIAYGQAGVEQFNGMFAFAFYDQQEEILLLGRDSFGQKPLFYFESNNYLIVSSEIKTILASGLVRKELNADQLSYYLTFKFAQRPYTFFQNIFEVSPGHVFTALPDQPLQPTTRIQPYATQSSEVFSLEKLDQIMLYAVQQHLRADVPAGLFLSGGVDSTLLLAMAGEAGYKHLPVFFTEFTSQDQRFSTQDQHFALQAAHQFGAAPQPVQVSSQLLNSFEDWVGTIDQPIADGAAWLTYLLAKEAKKQVTVVLSGAGADELFAGYNRHWAFYQYLKHRTWLLALLPLIKKSASLLPTQTTHPLLAYVRLWHKLASQVEKSPSRTFVNFTAFLPLFLPHSENLLSVQEENQFTEKGFQQALAYDQANFLSADVLALTDRMAMQHAVEVRMPYLDTEVVRLMQSIPADYLLQKGKKWILKELLNRRKGEDYTRRRKEGFGMPLGHWLKTESGKPLIELLQNKKSVIYDLLLQDSVLPVLQQHLSGKMDYTAELWSVIVLAGWLEKEFR